MRCVAASAGAADPDGAAGTTALDAPTSAGLVAVRECAPADVPVAADPVADTEVDARVVVMVAVTVVAAITVNR
jgi:hypothetical protein